MVRGYRPQIMGSSTKERREDETLRAFDFGHNRFRLVNRSKS